MTAHQIQLLVLLLPANSPYFQRLFGTRPSQAAPSFSERLQLALSDPALLWNMAESYAEANLPLPEFPWPASVRRAHDFLIDPERIDENLTQARDLQTPDHWAERDLLRALILCEDATPQRIADVMGLDIEVVELFELWWNLTSRKRELLYVAQLVNGSDGDLGASLMRVARITGKVRAVLLAAGRAGPNEKGSDEELFEQLERAVLTVALVRQQMGLLGKEQNPALALVEKYLLGLPRTAEIDLIFSDPLLALSLDKDAQRVFREHVQRQAAEQMRAERSQAAEKAQEKTGAPDYEI